jgi:hypothetical protein
MAVAVLLMALAVPAVVLAHGENDFDGVVGALETRYHAHATHVPFMGLAGLMGKAATHGGVSRMKVAEFENFTAEVDGAELEQLVTQRLGSGWERMIRETSRKGLAQTLIFTRPEGNRVAMFIVDLDGKELDVVEVSVDPERLGDQIAQHAHHHGRDDDGEQASD